MLGTPHLRDIGGAQVLRTFVFGDRRMFAGLKLAADELAKIPTNNRNALIDAKYIHVWPRDVVSGGLPDEHKECHVVARGFGKYDVVQGKRLNKAALTREQAHE